MAVEKRLALLNSDLADAKVIREKLEKDYENLCFKYEEKEMKLKELKDELEQIKSQNKQVEELENRMKILSNEKATLQSTNINLENEIKKLIDEKEVIQTKNKTYCTNYNSVKAFVQSAQNQLTYQLELSKKLVTEIKKMMTKIEQNKKDSISNEKVKKILELISERYVEKYLNNLLREF